MMLLSKLLLILDDYPFYCFIYKDKLKCVKAVEQVKGWFTAYFTWLQIP